MAKNNLDHRPVSPLPDRSKVVLVMQNSQISSKSRSALPRLLAPRNSFSAAEVRQRLQIDRADDPRTAAVHAAAARTSLWHGRLSERVAFDLGRAAERLPTVVYWYRQGVPSHEIGRRLSPFGGSWDADRALNVASALIAHVLNRGDFDEHLAA